MYNVVKQLTIKCNFGFFNDSLILDIYDTTQYWITPELKMWKRTDVEGKKKILRLQKKNIHHRKQEENDGNLFFFLISIKKSKQKITLQRVDCGRSYFKAFLPWAIFDMY